MKATVSSHTVPSTSAELERILATVFEKLTERSLDNPDPIFISRYDQGGMSSGMVCPEFWRNTAVPLILSRHSAITSI